MSHIPGGGPQSKNVVRPNVRTGKGSESARPAGVSQLGQMQGDHVTTHGGGDTGYRGERLHNDRSFQPVKFGNELALNVKGGGPGTGRTLHGQSGSQGCHGTPAQGEAGLPSGAGTATCVRAKEERKEAMKRMEEPNHVH
jgi:hypothetical protein